MRCVFIRNYKPDRFKFVQMVLETFDCFYERAVVMVWLYQIIGNHVDRHVCFPFALWKNSACAELESQLNPECNRAMELPSCLHASDSSKYPTETLLL